MKKNPAIDRALFGENWQGKRGRMRERITRLQQKMDQAGIDALVCRLPENLVYLTDYWPRHGFSAVLMPRQGLPVLFVPAVEQEGTNPDWAEVEPFGWGLLQDADLYDNFRRLIGAAARRFNLAGKKIGLELSFEVTAPTYRIAEPVVPSGPWQALMHELFAESILVDAAPLLEAARAVKGTYELEKLKIVNQIAEMGIRAALNSLAPGMTEVQAGALIEYKIRRDGPGTRGAKLVRAAAEVGAGPVNSSKGSLLVPSSSYVLQEGDLVMIELATVADGYFSDLTAMGVVGQPSARQREVYNALLEAQQAAAAQMCPGNLFDAPDRAARAVLQKAGLGEYFVHITGHGVGYRYHENIPFLSPGNTGVLEEGMVSSVEPGIYIPGLGGVRIEDNVAVTSSGPLFLSTPRLPW